MNDGEQQQQMPFHDDEEDFDEMYYNSKKIRDNISPHAVAELFPSQYHTGSSGKNGYLLLPTRERVLKRLCEPLLQCSLTKVRIVHIFATRITDGRYFVIS